MSNDYYNTSGTPAQSASLTSPPIRSEYAAITAGFNKLPTLTGNAYKIAYINASGSAMDVVGGDGLLKLSSTGVPIVATAGTDYISATTINASSAAVPNDADVLCVIDGPTAKKLSLTNLKAFLKTYFDGIYTTAATVSSYVSGLIGSTIQAYNANTIAVAHGISGNVLTSNGSAWVSSAGSPIPIGMLSGLILSTAGASTTMAITAGTAADSAAAVLMSLASAISKTTSAWVVGTGNGGLDTGAIANSTWYHFYLIRRPDTGVVDVVFSTNATSPTLPTNYTQYRRIGSGKTNGSAQWVKFVQNGDDFYWDTPAAADLNGAGSVTAVSLTVNVPTGIKVKGYFNLSQDSGAGGDQILYISDPSCADVAPAERSTPGASLMFRGTANSRTAAQATCWTNTSAQIRYRSTTTYDISINTLGWVDTRGK